MRQERASQITKYMKSNLTMQTASHLQKSDFNWILNQMMDGWIDR